MRVGLVEICEPNHYTAVSALAETYLSNPTNEVFIFATPEIKLLLKHLSGKVEWIILADNQTIKDFLALAANYPLDRIHINTISKYFADFAHTEWPNQIYFTIHNIDIWYGNSLYKRMITLFSDYWFLAKEHSANKNYKLPLILFVKDFWRQHFRNRFIRQISKKDYHIIVYSQSQKAHLQKYLYSKKVIVFPFCLHKQFNDLSSQNQRIRFCIPGSVSNKRRNYTGLFRLCRQYLNPVKQDICFDLLGYIPDEDRFLIAEIESLKSAGFQIIYNEGFVDSDEFDERLSLCDFILGNLNVRINHSKKYGETKETGIIFNIIKSGKPGIMPHGYPLDEELKDICLYFKDDAELGSLLINLTKQNRLVAELKQKTARAVKHYQAPNLYPLLLN